MECKPPLPIRLKWDFSNQQLVKNIDQAYEDASKIVNVSEIVATSWRHLMISLFLGR
jgi:hypothetical protein